MVFNLYVKQRILFYHSEGFRAPTITQKLRKEGIIVSRRGVGKVITRYYLSGNISRRPDSGRPSKITAEIKRIVDLQMEANNETTAVQMHAHLVKTGHNLSLATILRCCSSLGWTFRGSAYCQLIRDVNKTKRLEWAKENLGGKFEDVIFSGECSIQLETHWRFCCRKQGQRPKPKPR